VALKIKLFKQLTITPANFYHLYRTEVMLACCMHNAVVVCLSLHDMCICVSVLHTPVLCQGTVSTFLDQ